MTTKIKLSLAPLLALAILFACSAVASAQSAKPWHVAQGADGTLYLISSNVGHYEINPAPMTDADLAMPDLGALPDATPVNPVNIVADQPPVTFTQTGTLNTRPFDLQGGNYTASFVATDAPDSKTDCTFYAHLKAVAADSTFYGEQIASGFPSPTKPAGGETQVYSVPAGQYYVEATGASCGMWTVTISTQQ